MLVHLGEWKVHHLSLQLCLCPQTSQGQTLVQGPPDATGQSHGRRSVSSTALPGRGDFTEQEKATGCSRCTEKPPRPGLGLSPAGQSPVALGVLEQRTELSGAEQEAGAARREERSHRHTGLQGSWSERTHVSMHVCVQACVRGRQGGLQKDSGTLEPCLAKTSHSPLVSAISSLMGHLNSSGSKERKR